MSLLHRMKGKQPKGRVTSVIKEQVVRLRKQQVLTGQLTLTGRIRHHVRLNGLPIQHIMESGEAYQGHTTATRLTKIIRNGRSIGQSSGRAIHRQYTKPLPTPQCNLLIGRI